VRHLISGAAAIGKKNGILAHDLVG